MRYSSEMVKSMVGVVVMAVAGYMACFDSAGRVTGIDEEGGGKRARDQPSLSVTGSTNECASPQPGWIWCDDFEQDRLGSYFEYVGTNGSFARTAGVGLNASSAMRAHFQAGQVDAG